MAYVNGAAHHDPSPLETAAVVNCGDNQPLPVPAERLQKIRELLSEAFDSGEIKWRVTATSTQQTKQGPQKRGQLVAYADQRAYTDRLNEVFGEWGWTRNYDVQVAQNFERRAPGDKKQTAVSAKVVVVSKVTIHGLGSHTGVGEEWADDENAATRAEKPVVYRSSFQIPGRKRPVRHVVLLSKELFETTLGANGEARRTVLFDDGAEFVLHRLSVRFGLPVLPAWASWFREELARRRLVEPLLGFNCLPLAVKGTKLRLLRVLAQGLRRSRIQVPDSEELPLV